MVLTFYRAGRKRLFNGIFDNSTVSACNQPEICDAHSSDLGECSRKPAADPSATSFLPCFQTAKPSPKKGPMSTAKKANKNSTRKRSTITMAGIGFPRSPSWNRVLLALGPTIDPTLGATKRGLTSLDVANNTAGYRKLLPLLTFFICVTYRLHRAGPNDSSKRGPPFWPGNLVKRTTKVPTSNCPNRPARSAKSIPSTAVTRSPAHPS